MCHSFKFASTVSANPVHLSLTWLLHYFLHKRRWMYQRYNFLALLVTYLQREINFVPYSVSCIGTRFCFVPSSLVSGPLVLSSCTPFCKKHPNIRNMNNGRSKRWKILIMDLGEKRKASLAPYCSAYLIFSNYFSILHLENRHFHFPLRTHRQRILSAQIIFPYLLKMVPLFICLPHTDDPWVGSA